MSNRRTLPTRREGDTWTLEHGPHCLAVTVNCWPVAPDAGLPAEVFVKCPPEGSQLNLVMDDFAAAISVALQHGVRASAMAKSIGRLPIEPSRPDDLDPDPALAVSRPPASILGTVLDLLADIEAAAT